MLSTQLTQYIVNSKQCRVVFRKKYIVHVVYRMKYTLHVVYNKKYTLHVAYNIYFTVQSTQYTLHVAGIQYIFYSTKYIV